MNEWIAYIKQLHACNQPCVLATIVETAGSSPRAAGTKMVIGKTETLGTIGGGNLEYHLIQSAREQLNSKKRSKHSSNTVVLKKYVLGTELGQCCGGTVTLQLEHLIPNQTHDWLNELQLTLQRGASCTLATQVHQQHTIDLHKQLSPHSKAFNGLDTYHDSNESWVIEHIQPNHFNIVIYGAGHVGKALVNVLKTQPCHIHWIDNRADMLNLSPDHSPNNVTMIHTESPTATVSSMPDSSYYLIMTHDHALDMDLCDHILNRHDTHYIGLIGSKTKAARFKHRLLKRGLSQRNIDRITCPIGINGITDKHPSSIAISVSAQLLQLHELHKNTFQHDHETRLVLQENLPAVQTHQLLNSPTLGEYR